MTWLISALSCCCMKSRREQRRIANKRRGCEAIAVLPRMAAMNAKKSGHICMHYQNEPN